MATVLKLFLLRFLATKSFGGVATGLAVLALPIAGVLKVVGLPLLLVLGIVALPIALVLAVVGLPILLVLGTVGVITAALGGLLAVGATAIKIVVPIVLLVWFVRWMFRRDKEPAPEDTAGAAI
jgi:hypothetical protein